MNLPQLNASAIRCMAPNPRSMTYMASPATSTCEALARCDPGHQVMPPVVPSNTSCVLEFFAP